MGASVTIVGSGAVIVADASMNPDLQALLTTAVSVEDSFGAIVAALSAHVRALPSLVCAISEQDGIRLLLRGDAEALVTTKAGEQCIAPGLVSTWAEHTVAISASLVLRHGEAGSSVILPGLHSAPSADVPEPAPRIFDEPIPALPEDAPDLPSGGLAEEFDPEPEPEPEPEPGTASRPSVQAVLCDLGHPNPVGAGACRTCGHPLTDHTTHQVPRPSLGRLVFSDGLVVELDSPVLIGRAPVVSLAGSDLPETPELITLASQDKRISRLHAEVRIDGWQVFVLDASSLNGTVVTQPGQPPFQLSSGEPWLVELGSSVNLGGAVSFTFEGPS